MIRNNFEARARRSALAALVLFSACGGLPGVATAQGSTGRLPTGDDAASVMADTRPPAVDPSRSMSDPPIELEREVVNTSDARWLEGVDGDFKSVQLSSRFGVRPDPFRRGQRMHSGVDLPLPYGVSVPASAPGVIVFAGWAGGYGNMVEIDHGNGLATRYAHLSRIDVQRYQQVASGQQVGRVGSTGRSTGSHLHYEVRVNGRAIDPMSGRISIAIWQDANLSPWIAPRSEPVDMRQTWSEPSRDNSLPQPIVKH